MSLLIESAIKGALIVALALGVMPLLRKAPAAFRHSVVSAALLCSALAPLLVLVVPWQLPLGSMSATVAPPFAVRSTLELPSAASSDKALDSDAIRAAEPARQTKRISMQSAMRFVWTAGVVCVFAMLLVEFSRLSRVMSRASRITEGTWFDGAEQIRREYAISAPVTLLASAQSTLLVTCGFVRPKLIVPAAALSWDENRIRMVLYHELAHARRRDWIVQLAAELLRAVYWFNPLVWIACRRLRVESERACDDAVLNRGIEAPEYAMNLVSIARDLKRHQPWLAGAAMAHTSGLETRVRAMLDSGINRRPVSRIGSLAALLALLTIAVPIGSVAAFQTSLVTLSGAVVDPMNAALPDVTIVLTNVASHAKHEVRSGPTGRYEIVGLPPGQYVLEARLPGFATLRTTENIAGQDLQRDLALQLGSVHETIVVGDKDAAMPSDSKGRETRRRPAPACGATPVVNGVPIGGNVRAPIKLIHVRPEYPAALRNSGVEGTVILQGRLGADGMLHELTATSAPHAELVKAAIDAASQWEFEPTLLNCVAVEIPIRIDVTFQP